MATAAPRLAAGQLCRGQLPAEVTGFIGRRAELACLAGLLPGARLVTVTGPGGVGKTRVAVRAAASAAAKFSDGVCFVDLAEAREPSQVTATVAACLGLRDDGGFPDDSGFPDDGPFPGDGGPFPDDSPFHGGDGLQDVDGPRDRGGLRPLVAHLRNRQLLLVLDTCEHLVDACAAFAESLLREVAGVTLLATSREPFDIPGEHTIPIPPLPVPGADDTVNGTVDDTIAVPSLGPRGDAIELFAQRAAAASPAFRLTGETLPHVLRICRHLDGIPLALEMAAVRLRALPLAELSTRLEHRFQMLDGGRRGAVPRHQTLSTAIRWSYDLCTPAEQTLWARLSVFAGSFDVAAAEQVCAGPRAASGPGGRHSEIIGPLIGLVDKSVVLREESGGNRYRMPGALREFGALRLADSGEETDCRDRHLSYFLASATRLSGPRGTSNRGTSHGDTRNHGQRARFDSLRASHDDLRAALRHDPAGPLSAVLYPYWIASGRLPEGKAWLDQAIARPDEQDQAGQRPDRQRPGKQAKAGQTRAEALLARAVLRALGGEAGAGAEDARAGIRIASGLGSAPLEARGYLSLHAALTLGGWESDAAAAGAEADRRLSAVPDSAGLLLLGAQQAHLLQLTGSPEDALRQCERTLRRLQDQQDQQDVPWWLRGGLHTISALACIQLPGAESRCAAYAVQGLRASGEAGDVLGTAYALEVLAWAAAAAGRPQRAAWLIGAADPLWKRAGARLSGTAVLAESHDRAVKSASDGLGAQRFESLRAQGAAGPLETVLASAEDDADDLSAARTGSPGQETDAPADNGVPRSKQSELTSREREIAALVAKGLSNREIAAKLVISKRTVDAHVEHIFGKLGMSSRVQLTLWLRDNDGDGDNGRGNGRGHGKGHGRSKALPSHGPSHGKNS